LARPRYLALLEGDDGQRPEGPEKLAGPEQEVRVARAAEALVTLREGLVDNRAPGRQRRCDRGEERPVEIIGHDDTVEAAAERPGRAGLQIDRLDAAARPGERREGGGVAVDGMDFKAAIEQQSGMAPATGGEVEHAAACGDQRQETQNPDGTSLFIAC